ncbi:MAG: YebC/PmpR family DNA-binding transcriptional regulator [Patescibacteria group bacterium]|jgi:YebC/PmpR family DNA-binding regulatory protein
MSGHSKWAQIKRKKGAADVKRGKLFSRLAKQISVAARTGKNLETYVGMAKAENMPKDIIERAIKKGTGELGDGAQIEEVLYEAYGPNGSAFLITTLTDNRNRTVADLRATFNKYGLTLANSGAVQYLFDHRAIVTVPATGDADAVQLAIIDAGADDVVLEDDVVVGYARPTQLDAVRQALQAAGHIVQDARIGYVPKLAHVVDDVTKERILRILEVIDDLDDVESVETNAEL